jgi:hypothetical protein
MAGGSTKKKSTFRLWRLSAEGLAIVEETLRTILKKHGSEFDITGPIMDQYLRISRECDNKLMTELKARQMANELRDHDLGEMTSDEIEQMFTDHSKRRGLRRVTEIRNSMLEELIKVQGLDATTANEMVDRAIPKVPELKSHELGHKLRKTIDRQEAELDEGHEALETILEHSLTSEELEDLKTKELTIEEVKAHSDETEGN